MATPLYNDIHETKVLLRSGGDLASGIAVRLFNCGFKICIVETGTPLAVRRMVSFSEAVYDGEKTVEGVTAVRIDRVEEIDSVWAQRKIPVLIDQKNQIRHVLKPDVLVDAIVAKRNTGTHITDAPLVIALGPGFSAGKNCHVVIETNRGHHLGRLIFNGTAAKNTGIPSKICGFTTKRVLRAPCDGVFTLNKNIGARVSEGAMVGVVSRITIQSQIDGIIRGILRDGTPVTKGTKIGDVDPRGDAEYCQKISDKARSISGAVVEAILSQLPKPTPQK